MRSSLQLALLASTIASAASAAVITGPSSSASPYLVPLASNWSAVAILTAGDNTNPAGAFRPFVGIPDGIGAYDNGNGTVTVLVNHELPAAAGAVRAHGAPGAFVDQLVIDKNTLAAVSGQDLATSLVLNGSVSEAINRLCSATLAPVSAFYNAVTGKGYNGRIFTNGEEAGPAGRAFGWVVGERTAYELPRLGRFSWENAVPNALTGDRTVVAGTDDSAADRDAVNNVPAQGRVHIYLGAKTDTGSAVDKAGLTNGQDYVLAIVNPAGGTFNTRESRDSGLPGAGAINDAALVKQAADFVLLPAAVNPGPEDVGTGFLRPEDFTWDRSNPNVGYFVTTDRYDSIKDGTVDLNSGAPQVGRSRLWRVTFDDITAASPAGRIEMLLSGTETQNMMDNITQGSDGRIYIQEDTGRQYHNSKILAYDPVTGSLDVVFEHDPVRFGNIPNIPGTLTIDEESSGIVDVTDIFRDSAYDFGGRNRFFLADVQAHYPLPGELVEGGQLLLLIQAPEPAAAALFGLGALALTGLRRRAR